MAASAVGSASASSSELVCSELVPPSTAASAWRSLRASSTCSAPRPRTWPLARRTDYLRTYRASDLTPGPVIALARRGVPVTAKSTSAQRDRARPARRPDALPGNPVETAPAIYVKARLARCRSSAAPLDGRVHASARPRRALFERRESGRCSRASRGRRSRSRRRPSRTLQGRQAARRHGGQPLPRLHARPRRRRQLRHQLRRSSGGDDGLPADDRRGVRATSSTSPTTSRRAVRRPGQRRQAGDRHRSSSRAPRPTVATANGGVRSARGVARLRWRSVGRTACSSTAQRRPLRLRSRTRRRRSRSPARRPTRCCSGRRR